MGKGAWPVLLAGCVLMAGGCTGGGHPRSVASSSTPAVVRTSPAITRSPVVTPTRPVSAVVGRLVQLGDVDGDGRPDSARLIWLARPTRNNWQLVVYLSREGKQRVGFLGDALFRGAINAPVIVGSVDADRDGRSDIFVKISSGASTQFWTIFKFNAGRVLQVTQSGQTLSLAVGGSVTHQGGFRCDGAQFVETGASFDSSTSRASYASTTYMWNRATLVLVSRRTGSTTLSGLGTYGQIECGHLPQYASAYTGPWPAS